MIKKTLILLIAGSSKRFLGKIKKQFVKINNKPLFIYTLESMLKFKFDNIIIASLKEDLNNIKKIINKNLLNGENISYVEGGSERVYSVYNAMKFIKENNINTDFVFIHDGVRPIVSKKEIKELYDNVVKKNAVILASKVVDTIKKVDSKKNIIETIDRNFIYRAATPQAFNFRRYMMAMEKYMSDVKYKKRLGKKIATDDAEIYSAYAGKVAIVECSSNNIKITNKEDLNLFLNLLQQKP
ncbi:IspD/TarI family cytidylyltransferase [Brachyspira catarrhinii]|uniref:2-C-methyl-D-erythritol 4-phosphate cytidylyltransferase n=1 Tax=Brachyspira catarrhinii TaxID=2528966 RepID=A0ABY2TST1_9SPIR|nr:IspD/TarI family cytidylyltransferase [Brachyspira catarrhinii]TKZ35638.1 2-C-methyl-D-erythritol 4-phosphate cytidylyltransferase [Brachyspira catarrhinii]